MGFSRTPLFPLRRRLPSVFLLFVLFCPLLFCPLPSLAQNETSPHEYRDKTSGDEAFRERQYAVAVSFYRAYRKAAELRNDKPAARDAIQSEIDALIGARMPERARAAIKEFDEKFPGANPTSVALWNAEIFLLENKPAETRKIIEPLVTTLHEHDPGRIRALKALAYAFEMLKNHTEAAKVYAQIVSLAGETPLGGKAAEREILNLAASGDANAARDKLRQLPLAKDQRALQAQRLLNLFLRLNSESEAALSDLKKHLETKDQDPIEDPGFAFVIYSLIAETCLKQNDPETAIAALRTAYDCAPSPDQAFDATRAIFSIMKEKEPVPAAELAWKQYSVAPNFFQKNTLKKDLIEILLLGNMHREAYSICKILFANPNLAKDGNPKEFFDSILATFLAKKDYPHADRLLADFGTSVAEIKPGEVLLRRAEILRLDGKLDPAARQYLQIAQDYPELYPQAMTSAAHLLFENKDYTAVIAIAGKLLDKNDKDPIRFLRAGAYEMNKEFASAIEDYHRFAELPSAEKEPPNLKPQAWYRAGRLALTRDNLAIAMADFKHALRDFPDSEFAPVSAFWMIHCMYALGDEIAAEKETWLLAEKYPDSEYAANAMLKLAAFYSSAGSSKKAESALDHLVEQKKYPRIQARAIYEKAVILFKARKFGESNALIRTLEAQFPDTPILADALYLKGDILKENHSFQQAAAAYSEAAKRKPGSPLELAAFGATGDCLFAIATKSDNPALFAPALESYRKILEKEEINPREFQAMALYKAARCCQLAGKDGDAFDYLKKLLFLVPPREAFVRPAEVFWIVKGVDALDRMANSNPTKEHIDTAIQALNWLRTSYLQDEESVRKRINAIRRKKFKP